MVCTSIIAVSCIQNFFIFKVSDLNIVFIYISGTTSLSNREIIVYTLVATCLVFLFGVTRCARKCKRKRKSEKIIDDNSVPVNEHNDTSSNQNPYYEIYHEIDEEMIIENFIPPNPYLEVVDTTPTSSTVSVNQPIDCLPNPYLDVIDNNSTSSSSSHSSRDDSGYLQPHKNEQETKSMISKRSSTESSTSQSVSSENQDMHFPAVHDGYLTPLTIDTGQDKSDPIIDKEIKIRTTSSDEYLNPYKSLEGRTEHMNEYKTIVKDESYLNPYQHLTNKNKEDGHRYDVTAVIHAKPSDDSKIDMSKNDAHSSDYKEKSATNLNNGTSDQLMNM